MSHHTTAFKVLLPEDIRATGHSLALNEQIQLVLTEYSLVILAPSKNVAISLSTVAN